MKEVKVLTIKPIRTDEETAALAGTMLKESDCKILITEDTDVYCAETGKAIAKFRKKVIPAKVQKAAFENLKKVASPQDNRGISAGWDVDKINEFVKKEGGKGFVRTSENGFRFRIIKADGTLSNTSRAVPVLSNIIGYFDRNPRFPNCRQTAFNQKEFQKFKQAYPIIRVVDKYYADLMPDQYALQRAQADATSRDFVIKDTAFTTVTVNKNWQTAVHTDKGDFEKGFGNLVALRAGRYTGGYFVVPKWGVGFDLQNGDILLADVHQWHGNTPIHKIDKKAVRLSLVMYYRKNMIHCGTALEEAERAKRRKRGDKING